MTPRSGRSWLVAGGLAAGSVAGRIAVRAFRRMDLSGKVAIVTGGSRGLGLAIARELASKGVAVAICGRDERQLEEARRSIGALGSPVTAVRCDVGRRDDVDRMVEQVVGTLGRLDILVNNAGVMSCGPFEAQTEDDFREALDVMAWAILHTTRAALPHLRARGDGRIVNITSIGGKVAVPHLLPYVMAKFAAVGLSEGLSAELARQGIRVTTVVPGLMRTGSYLNARFVGDPDAESSWFSLSATTPLLAMGAERAARKIVRAMRDGRSEVVLTPQARAMVLAMGLAPGLVTRVLGAVDRLLPEPGRGDRRLGRDARGGRLASRLAERGAGGRDAAHELLQHPPEG